ncbi:MAG: RNA methyltransferase, partial [Eubacterium sp.]|nr:RNA methyltransferase [Eubacterium sp.]
IRTAEALGINGAICYNCCDIYNPKALRASMGSILRLPVILSDNLVSDIEAAKENGFSFYATVPDKHAEDITKINFPASSVIIIGNEGNGISEEVKAAANKLVTINMLGRAESLNASMAGAIAMWEMLR